MYHILIVDDEPIIVDGLYDLFSGIDDIELQLYKAYSGDEALALMNGVRMDILFTDIRMPGLDGIELQRVAAERWPLCRVIFLSGHNDFAYAQAAIRQGGVDYILKTENFQVVEQALRKAVQSVSEQIVKEAMIRQAKERMQRALPVLQREFLLDMLEERTRIGNGLGERFAECELGLAADAPAYLLVGRVDEWGKELGESDRQLLLYAIENIACEYLAPASVYTVPFGRYKLVWLIQFAHTFAHPLGQAGQSTDTAAYIENVCESVHAKCGELLQLSVSFAVSEHAVAWQEAPAMFHRLKRMLASGIGQAPGSVLQHQRSAAEDVDDREFRRLLQQVSALELHVERGALDVCEALIGQVAAYCEDMPAGGPFQQEAYYSIALQILTCLNRYGLADAWSAQGGYSALLQMDKHASWRELERYLASVVAFIIQHRHQERDEQANDVVDAIHSYIDAHYDGDLSLTRLSGIVHLNASYLCRLYKQLTGVGLSDYIVQYRMAKAKELLHDPFMKIQDVAVRVGFETSAYFGRVFKKTTDMTPQEYKESVAGRDK